MFQRIVSLEKSKHRKFRYRLKIKRRDIFEDGYQTLSQVPDLRSTLVVTFVNEFGIQEEGQDAGGILKEFLVELSQIIFNPNFGFFSKTEVDEDLYPNPQSTIFGHLDYDTILKYYNFFGKILGKAMFDGILIEPKFARFFLKRLTNKSNMISDLKSLDKELFKNLNFLKTYEGNFEDLCLDFTCREKDEITGKMKTYNLITNGQNLPVTKENRFKYIYLMMDFKLNRRMFDKLKAFSDGFHSVIPVSSLKLFNEDEIQKLISGTST